MLDGRSQVIADEDTLAPQLWQWAVLRTRAIDELTGQPPRVPVRVVALPADSPLVARMTPRAVAGGLCGLAARIDDAAVALTRTGAFGARIEAAGYLPCDLTPAVDSARRSLALLSPAGTNPLQVAPPDPLPAAGDSRAQFRPGRGVVIERSAVDPAEQTSIVADIPPAAANEVPIVPPLRSARAAGARVSGVPVHLADQPLHRAATVRLRGQVQQRLPGPPPALVPGAGAQLGILGYWPTYPSAVSGASLPPDFCALSPALPLAHDPGVAVSGCTLAPAGAPRRLAQPAAAGSDMLWVQPHTLLNPAGGDLLQLEADASAECEWAMTLGFTPPADPLAPARVRLAHATAYLHRAGAPLLTVVAGGLVAAGAISREAQAGDPVLFATNLGALAGSGRLAVAHGTPRASYHRFTQLPRAVALPLPAVNQFAITHPVVADADGRFEWPLLARVAQIEIAVMHAGLSIAPRRFALDYEGSNPLSILVP
jgi:hypothetical protein